MNTKNTNRKIYLQEYRKKYQSKSVNITLRKEEYSAFSRSAQKEKLKIASYVKKLALSSFHSQAYIPAELKEELQTLRFAVLNIANNVNQIAHHSNRIQALTEDDEQNLLLYMKQLDDVVKEYTSNSILNPNTTNDY